MNEFQIQVKEMLITKHMVNRMRCQNEQNHKIVNPFWAHLLSFFLRIIFKAFKNVARLTFLTTLNIYIVSIFFLLSLKLP